MAMNKTQIALDVKGVNRTGKVFREIASSALRVGKTVSLIGASAFAGTAAAFAATAKSLGHLSDVAMQTGTSAKELTQLSAAMDVLGIKSAQPEQLAMAFQKMAKSVGETGMGGFKRTIQAISELGTVEERSAAAMAVFGKSGLDFMPLIEAAAKGGVDALDDVIASMPGISDEAANAGDAVADAMSVMTRGAKSLWSAAIGSICASLEGKFTGGVREAALRAVAYMEYFVKSAHRSVTSFCHNAVELFRQMGGSWNAVFLSWGDYMVEYFKNLGKLMWDVLTTKWGEGYTDRIGAAIARYGDAMEEAADKLWEGVDWSKMVSSDNSDLRAALEDKLAAAAKGAAAIGSAAVGFTSSKAAGETAEKIQTAMRQARNEFMKEGSYKAATLSMRADYGSSADKQVKAVNAVKSVNEKIQKAAEKTAEAISEIGAV